ILSFSFARLYNAALNCLAFSENSFLKDGFLSENISLLNLLIPVECSIFRELINFRLSFSFFILFGVIIWHFSLYSLKDMRQCSQSMHSSTVQNWFESVQYPKSNSM